VAIRKLEAKQLDKEYMAWRFREIKAGRIAKSPVPPYDPAKKYVPPILESNRKTLGTGLPQLQKELNQYRTARATGQTIDYSRAISVADEVSRLKQQEADIAWSIREQTDFDEFVRGPRETKFTQPAVKTHPLKKAVGWWKKLSTRNKLLFGGAGVISATLAFGGKEEHNSIEGLHPFSEGMGTQILRAHSDFGSGVVRNKLLKRAGQVIRGFSEQEVVGLAKIAKTESVEAFAKRMGANLFSGYNYPKQLQKTIDRAGGAFGTIPEEAYSGILGKITKFISKRVTGGKPGKIYVDTDYFDNNEDLIKTAIFHEASEQRNIKAIASQRGWRSVWKEFEDVKSPTELLSHRTTVVQEDLFLRNLTNKTQYNKWVKDWRSDEPFYQTFSAKDDAWNTIEGLRHGGAAEDVRKTLTEFGSGYTGWRGLLATWKSTKEQVYREGIGAYQVYEWERTRSARETLSRFAEHKENQLKFPAMGDRETFAAHMRGEITEFKDQFASRWDPLRKLATKLYGESNEALGKLTARPEFKTAVSTALKGEGKLLGTGMMGEVRGYAAEMAIAGQKHKFEFATKTALSRGGNTASAIARNAEMSSNMAKSEALAMERLGHLRAPSLYGRGGDFGADESTIIMEKFQLTKPLVEKKAMELAPGVMVDEKVYNPLSTDEVTQLKSFMKTAHKKGITHTDMHGENVVRALDPETGKAEVAVLDWGLANRFERVGGIGGGQSVMVQSGAMADLQSQIQKNIGREVGPQEFSEVADMLRVEAHGQGAKAHRSSTLAVNALYNLQGKQGDLRLAQKELQHLKNVPGITPTRIQYAQSDIIEAQEAVGRGKKLLEEVADTVSDYILKGERKAPTVGLPNNLDDLSRTVQRGIKHNEIAYTTTELADATLKHSPVETNNLAATMAHRAKRAAVERNRRFEEITRRSVGIGLKKSAGATKGHIGFANQASTVVR
jgi:hypothetical protein